MAMNFGGHFVNWYFEACCVKLLPYFVLRSPCYETARSKWVIWPANILLPPLTTRSLILLVGSASMWRLSLYPTRTCNPIINPYGCLVCLNLIFPVPKLEIAYRTNHRVELVYIPTIPSATYTVNTCCYMNGKEWDRDSKFSCTTCPDYQAIPKKQCKDDKDIPNGIMCLLTPYGYTGNDIYAYLVVEIPGCLEKKNGTKEHLKVDISSRHLKFLW